MSFIAMTAAMASARAGQDTEISEPFSTTIYGNHAAGNPGTRDASADQSGNTVTFKGDAHFTEDDAYIYGSAGYNTDVQTPVPITDRNTVKVENLSFGDVDSFQLDGALASGGDAKGNNVVIKGGTFNIPDHTSYIYGAEVSGYYDIGMTRTAEKNAVTIEGGTFTGEFTIKGAYTHSGINSENVTLNVKDNAVKVTKGDFSGGLMSSEEISIIGGGAYLNHNLASAAVTGNAVTVEGGTFADDGSLDTLTIIGGEINNGSSIPIADSSITNNTVKVTGGSFKTNTDIYGGYTVNTGGTVTVADNEVYVAGGTFDKFTQIFGGYNYAGKVTGNKVTVSGGSFKKVTYIYGGYNDGNGKVTGNKVTVSGGTFDKYAQIFGGYNDGNGKVTGNKVTVSGGTFAENMTMIVGGRSNNGEVSGNEVHLSGGTFTDSTGNYFVMGGVSYTAAAVKNNTVYVSGDVDLSKVRFDAASKSGGGNTLVFGEDGKPWNSKDNKIKGIYGFDTVKITAATWNKPIVAAIFDTTYAKTDKTEIDATKVAFAGVDSVKKGDKTDLFVVEDLKAGSELTLKSETSTYTIGTTLQGKGTVAIEDEGSVVTYAIGTRSAQAQAHTAAMASAARMTALNQGADTATSALSNLSGSGKTGLQGFAAVGGGTARQETGSHVTVNAVNFTAGMGGTADTGAMKLTVGGAVEAGHGSFKNHFYAGDAEPYVSKKGDMNYYGGAVLSEMKWANDWHMNANLRAGYAKTEQTAALYNAGTNTAYDIDSGAYYVGTEFGGGKTLKLNEKNSIDLYGKYIYLHQGGDSFYAGGYYDVKGVDSHRLKAGARYDYGFNKTWGVYAGLAGEYEFDGKGRVIADGAEVPPAETKGMSGIGELGVKLTPEESGFSMDVNVKGSVGKYRSALFGIDVKYEF